MNIPSFLPCLIKKINVLLPKKKDEKQKLQANILLEYTHIDSLKTVHKIIVTYSKGNIQ